ncbi:MAG: hypothetical protein KGQ66_17380 [Acidobacteriota bacterium]|nr:hypothetical protein [Acidobacteriota bacterium]
MNSVAVADIYVTGPHPVAPSEADLFRGAARGQRDAFVELYRRHHGPAWRLAHAVCADPDRAVGSYRDAFARVARRRPVRRATGDFRAAVLGAVYQEALGGAPDAAVALPTGRRPGADRQSLVVEAAFRSLPERWRATIWLSEVEDFDGDAIAGVLSVSSGVAEQLLARGRRGLAGRLAQAGQARPDHLAAVLGPMIPPPPADLETLTVAAWETREGVGALSPISAWLEDRAVRPMGVAVGTLVGLGLIAIGIAPGGSTLRGQFGATGSSTLPGSVPVTAAGAASGDPGSPAAGAFGNPLLSASFPSSPGPSAATSGGYPFGGAAGVARSFDPAGSPSPVSAPAGSASGTSGSTTTPAGGTAPTAGTGATSGSGSGGSGSSGGSSSGGSGTTTLSVPGVGSVSTSPTGVLGTPTVGTSAGGATVTLNCGGTLVQASTCPTSTTAPAAGASPLGSVVGGVTGPLTSTATTLPVVGGLLGGTTQSVTTTVSGLLP